MLKGLLLIIVMVFIIGAIILLIAVNFIVSFIRRIRRVYFGVDDDDERYSDDPLRRRSNQYSFKRTAYSAWRTNVNDAAYRKPDNSQSGTPTAEFIVDTRDPNTANRKIISDDEGEYVDFKEEK